MLVAVLGHRGMLGRRVLEEFPDAVTFDERYTGATDDPLLSAIRKVKPDWIINCIGSTGEDMWLVNATLPHRLLPLARVIHASTDHVFDDTEYARSKLVGEAGYVIRCAIVDPDGGMLARARVGDTEGSVHRQWNGITAKWWARVAHDVIRGRYEPKPWPWWAGARRAIVPGSPTISHFDLLETARRTFGWPTVTTPETEHRWVASTPHFLLPPIAEQLAEYDEAQYVVGPWRPVKVTYG